MKKLFFNSIPKPVLQDGGNGPSYLTTVPLVDVKYDYITIAFAKGKIKPGKEHFKALKRMDKFYAKMKRKLSGKATIWDRLCSYFKKF